MRLFILFSLCLIITSASSHAAEITKAMADQYYQSCLQKPTQQKMQPENKDFLCACTASKMMDNMTTDDIAAMQNPDQTVARTAFHHMLTRVYAPCMEYPAKDHYYNTCISNPKTASLGQDPIKLCGCMSDKVANYLGANGEQLFEDIIRRNPNATDPMTALEADPEFQKYVGKQVLGCVL